MGEPNSNSNPNPNPNTNLYLYTIKYKTIFFDPKYNIPFSTQVFDILSNLNTIVFIANKQDFETKNLVYLRYRGRTRGWDLVSKSCLLPILVYIVDHQILINL